MLQFMKKTETKTRFTYFYRRERFESRGIFIYKNRYTEPELKLIDDLFNNLDESNLIIIKAFVNRKHDKIYCMDKQLL